MSRRRVARRVIGLLLMLSVACLGLTACTPGSPTATRVNTDGSISFVSCYAIQNVDYVSAVTEVRSGFPARIDDSKTVEMTLVEPIIDLVEGRVYTFLPGTDDWTEVSIFVAQEGVDYVAGGVDRNEQTVGQWAWNTGVRCEINE